MNKPTYFDKFRCLAGTCPDSCCKAGWEITVDDEAFDIYSQLGGDLGDRFATSLATGADGDKIFKLNDKGICPFYNCDGLCELYIATGGKMTEICANYPRFYEEFDGFTEAGISISCPEAIRLVLEAEDGAYALPEERSGDEMLDLLIDERRVAFALIDRCETADEAMIKILDRSARLQAKFDLNDLTPMDEPAELKITKTERSAEQISWLCRGILYGTDILCPEWDKALRAGNEGRLESKEISESIKKNYLRYLVFRYYLKAINSEDVQSYVMLICALYLLPQVLVGDFTELCRCAAKELEHNADNREAVLDGFYYGELMCLSELVEAMGAEVA